MSLYTYFKESFARKKARRVFQQYGTRIDTFHFENHHVVQFANWLNPLTRPKKITQYELDFFAHYIPKGTMVIDIGANIGDLTVSMAMAAGGNGLVLGIDPNPHVFAVLKENAKLNSGKSNIKPLQLAAAEKETTFYYASSEASMSNGGLIEDFNDTRHGKYKLKEGIQGVHFGRYLEQHYSEWLPKLSLIKTDTEGWDYFVLKTLEPVIAKYRPTIIAEIFHDIDTATREGIFNLLHQYGYTILNAGQFHTEELVTTREIKNKEDMPKAGLTENIIAIAHPAS